MKTVLITGANRGLGLAFTRLFLDKGDSVIACCRDITTHPDFKLNTNNLLLKSLDVCDPSLIETFANSVKDLTIDILINNAGIYHVAGYDYTKQSEPWQELLMTNTIAPYLLAHAIKENLTRSKHKKIINISSFMASIALNNDALECPYRASKVALNMITKNLSHEFSLDKMIVASLDPGWVRTDMGGPNGLQSAEQSTARMAEIIEGLTLADSGKFFSLDRRELPW